MQNLTNGLRAEFPFLVPESVCIPQGGRAENPQRLNTLSFKTMTDRVGRTGTYSMTVIDEFAFCDPTIQQQVLASVRPASIPCRIILSTPYRENDSYHQLCNQAELERAFIQT